MKHKKHLKQFVVIGCGRFGKACALKLSELGYEVLVIDNNEETVNGMSSHVTHAVCADVLTEDALESLGVSNFDVAIIGISSNFEAAIMATVSCKNLGVKDVVTKAKDHVHAEVLRQIGASRTVIPEHDTAVRLAKSITSNNIFDYIEVSENYSIAEIAPQEAWVGKNFQEIDLRNEYGINVVAVRSRDKIIVNPKPAYKIQKTDFLIVVGENNMIDDIAGVGE